MHEDDAALALVVADDATTEDGCGFVVMLLMGGSRRYVGGSTPTGRARVAPAGSRTATALPVAAAVVTNRG